MSSPYQRIPLPFPLIGLAGCTAEAWLYHIVTRDTGSSEDLVGRIARLRLGFESKLRSGFALLAALVFVVGWLGFSTTEHMHDELHVVRTMEHWLEHALDLERELGAQAGLVARLGDTTDPGLLAALASLDRDIAAELAHLAALPPPTHRDFNVGLENMQREAERRLPVVREASSRFGDLDAAVSEVIAMYRGGRTAEARARASSLGGLRDRVAAPLTELVGTLESDIRESAAQIDSTTHVQQILTLVVILLATAFAFGAGRIFSRLVVRPLQELERGLTRIGSGDLDHQIAIDNRDEIGALAVQVNGMAARLRSLYGELRALNANLERKVAEQVADVERARALKRYLSPQLAESIIAGRADARLASTRKNLTICFSDIRGFTGLAERMEPEELVELLNAYFTDMTEVVFKHGGTLDKYLGDGMLVFFGDPLPQADHAERAVRMAFEMRERLAARQRTWSVERGETLSTGIGISTGYVTVGNIGSPARLDYTVIGNNVNLASRLADMAAPGQILLAERTLAQVRELVAAKEIGEITVEGSARPVRVFEVLGLVT